MSAILSPDPTPSAATVQPSALRVCTRCVMDTSDPDISFDAEGVCHLCHDRDRLVRQYVVNHAAGRRRLTAIAEQIKRDGVGKPYDCVIGVSGGVDSTLVAYEVKQLGLRPLAVHLDNGWNSEIAVSNISLALKKLGIDLYTHVIDWEEFKDIQLAFLRASTADAEIPSDHAIFALMYQTATRQGVRHVITGCNVRTETHLPPAWSQGHKDWRYIREVHRRFGSGRIKTFPHFGFWDFALGHRWHQTTNLLDYVDFSKREALKFLERELSWRDYGGKHFESIYTRWFQGYYLPVKFGYDKRKTHLSSRICSGELTRVEALAELDKPAYPCEMQDADCEYVRKKFGLSEPEFEAIMREPRRRYEDYPNFRQYVRSQPWHWALSTWQFFKYRVLGRPRPAAM